MLPISIFTTLALLPHVTTAFPALDQTPVATWTRKLIPLPRRTLQARRDSSLSFAKRQGQGDGTAFDRNPDGSGFLWVSQDTYEGESFFEQGLVGGCFRGDV